MQFRKPLTAIAIILGFGAGAALPAMAQTGDMPAAPAPTAPATDFSEEQLMAFAEVAVEVSEIHEHYAVQLDAADSDAEREGLIEEGNAAMLAAVEEAPQITVEEYLEVGEAAAVDPELGQRISMIIQEMTAQ
ncbi:DUF4168 domain-containing protein [Alkalilacustris brevis]|uniref:DUF4168 domain-containing protein n=1 Tax=Alkalilacustris brevis TaxID=2026338 RepID=UPI00138FD982|nr:DUF4168 domain-containing protein [Alkalilacustris brevis]